MTHLAREAAGTWPAFLPRGPPGLQQRLAVQRLQSAGRGQPGRHRCGRNARRAASGGGATKERRRNARGIEGGATKERRWQMRERFFTPRCCSCTTSRQMYLGRQ